MNLPMPRPRSRAFTGDMLAISVDPPAIYGMVQFDDGGRMMADFTDCELDDVKVGLRVQMALKVKARKTGSADS